LREFIAAAGSLSALIGTLSDFLFWVGKPKYYASPAKGSTFGVDHTSGSAVGALTGLHSCALLASFYGRDRKQEELQPCPILGRVFSAISLL
jgi:hypothetical protein